MIRFKCKSRPRSAARQAPKSRAVCSDRPSLTGSKTARVRAALICESSDGETRPVRQQRYVRGVMVRMIWRGQHWETRSAGISTKLATRKWHFQRFGVIKKLATRADLAMLDFDFRRVPRLGPLWATLRIVGLRPKAIRTDRTRRGWHVLVELAERLQPAELVALQAVLGSDSRRECLNLMRVIAMRKRPVSAFWRKRWNLLFERKLD